MGNCCAAENKATENFSCPDTANKGHQVELRLLYFKVQGKHHNLIDPNQSYRFCDDPDCDVVYFGSQGSRILKEHLGEQVGIKEIGKSKDFPICHCFNFKKSDVENDIQNKGETNIANLVSQYIKQKLCACEIENPSGQCCLGFINKVINQAKENKK